MKKFPIFLFFVTCMRFATHAQTPAIHGKVIDDSTGTGLPDVSVVLSGTNKGTTTGADGSFTLAFPTDGRKHTLTFSHAGYGDEVLAATNTGSIFLHMKKKATQLEDVVVIRYQTVRRRDAHASISSVSAKELKDIPLNSAEESLAGRLAGVQVTGSEGSPNAQVLIRVRGGGSITHGQ